MSSNPLKQTFGALTDIQDNDRDGKLINAINARKEETGVQASIDFNGRLHLTALDGRGIYVSVAQIGTANGTTVANTTLRAMNLFGIRGMSIAGNGGVQGFHGGRLTLTKLDASDIRVSGSTGLYHMGFASSGQGQQYDNVAQTSVNLRGTLNVASHVFLDCYNESQEMFRL